MDKFFAVTKPTPLRVSSSGHKGASRFDPYSKDRSQRRLSSGAITKHLLSTLSDEKNPITHSEAGKRADCVISTATGHQRSETRMNRMQYLEHRGKKRDVQQAAAVVRADLSESASGESSQNRVLRNARVYINGYLSDTTDIEMKRTVALAGGTILQTASGATHILTSQWLSGSKTQKHLKTKTKQTVHVVRPEWVTESIKAGKRLPEGNFAVIKDHTTQDLTVMFASKR